MNRLLFFFILYSVAGWPVGYVYSQIDSIRTEISQEKIVPDTAHQTHTDRNKEEQKQVNELFRRSRQETTLIEIGLESPVISNYGSGILLLKDARPDIEKTRVISLWAGIERKLTPAWGIIG